MVFKSDNNPTVSNSDENGAIVMAAANAVSPINELNAANREALCKTASVVHVQRNDQVKPENSHRWMMFLVEGTLNLYSGKEEVGSISARTSEALQPLFQNKGDYQTAKTNTVAKIVKFGREQMDILLREQQKNAIRVVDVEVGERDNIVFDDIVAAMKNNTAGLATSSANAPKILTAFRKVAGIPELADVIQCDPGLAAHIVVAANRAEALSLEQLATTGHVHRLLLGTGENHIRWSTGADRRW